MLDRGSGGIAAREMLAAVTQVVTNYSPRSAPSRCSSGLLGAVSEAHRLERFAAAAVLARFAEHVLIDTLFCADRDSLTAASVDPGDLQQLIAERQHHGGGWTTLKTAWRRCTTACCSPQVLSLRYPTRLRTTNRPELFLAVAAKVR